MTYGHKFPDHIEKLKGSVPHDEFLSGYLRPPSGVKSFCWTPSGGVKYLFPRAFELIEAKMSNGSNIFSTFSIEISTGSLINTSKGLHDGVRISFPTQVGGLKKNCGSSFFMACCG